jgi:archaellum component FlaF (FlaF/FlaG flagellin family)
MTTSEQPVAPRNYVAVLAFCALLLLNTSLAAGQQHPTLVSINKAGTGGGNARSGDFNRYSITPDGRYVVFYSEAGDLFPLDSPRAADIFVRDLQTGTTTMASINAAGTSSTSISAFGVISDNGRYVAFTSSANNIVTNDTNSSRDVFLRDLQAGTTRLVSINAAGTVSAAGGDSELINMTPDGRFITFSSNAQNLTSFPDGNGFGMDIFVRDTVNNVTKLVTVNAAGTASGNGTSGQVGESGFNEDISSDGRYVVFSSTSSFLVPNDNGGFYDVFLRDLQASTTTRLSTNAAGTASGNNASSGAIIDRGGRFVVFATRASNLSTLPDTNDLLDIFIYDVQTGVKRLVTVNRFGTAAGNGITPGSGIFDHFVDFKLSGDARFVAFMSQSSDLVAGDTNGNNEDIFRYDVTTRITTLVSINQTGSGSGNAGSDKASISADGRFVAFESLANNLVGEPDETNGFTEDVFVRDVVAGKTYLASPNSGGTRTGNGFSFQPLLSADGTRLVFFSRASDLVTNDLNGFNEDIFEFTLVNGGSPVLLTEENTERVLALDSVIQTRDPFPLFNPFNFSSDQRTRVSLFVWRLELLPGEDASAVTVHAEDDQGGLYPLSVEYVGATPGLSSVKQVVVKLPEGVVGPRDLWVKVSLHGATSNRVLLKIKAP